MKKQGWKTVKISFEKTFKIIWQYKKLYILISVCVNVLQGLFPVLSIKILQKIINYIQIKNVGFGVILYWICIYVFIGCLITIIDESYSFYSSKFSMNFAKNIDAKLINKAMSLKLLDFEDSETYNIINRAQVESGSNLLSYFDSFLSVLKGSTTLVTSVYIISQFKIWIVPVILIIPSIKYVYSLKVSKKQFDITVARTGKERQLWYIEFLSMTGKAFKEIRLNGLKEYLEKKYEKIKKEMIAQDVVILQRMRNVNMALSIGEGSISGGLIAYLLYYGYKNFILVGDITTYINCIDNIKNNIIFIFTQIRGIFQKSLSVELFHYFLEMKEKKLDKGKELLSIKTIELINVSYKYKNSEKYALQNITFKIKIGDITGVLGENGSGKSTLMKIILGFYEDYTGEILINGIDLRDINLKSYYKKVSGVFQDYIQYETNLRENIAYGNIEDIENEQKMLDMLKFSNLKKEIYEERGLDTILGNWFGEKQLSSGEWQRIAIARAFFKDANLYILDEADASLDVVIEDELLKKYRMKIKNNMGIFITHKISHAKEVVNEIIVLKEGKIVQKGPHNDLINQDGEYKKLYNLHKKL